MCPTNVTLFCVFYFVSIFSLFHGYHAEGYHAPSIPHGLSRPGLSRSYHHCAAITPVYASRLSRYSIFLLLRYHTRAITLHHTRTSGYHTRHSSSHFVAYLSPTIMPPVLLHLHHHRAPHVPTYSTKRQQVSFSCGSRELDLIFPILYLSNISTDVRARTSTSKESCPFLGGVRAAKKQVCSSV